MGDDDLTPIRVRGKRHKIPVSQDKETARRRQKRRGKYPQGRVPVKPSKRKVQENIPPRDGKRIKSEGTKISRLEALPAELIEKIFLDSLEPNLAWASPRFGAILSRKRIYKILTFLAFFNDHEPPELPPDDNVASFISNILRPLKYVPLDVDTQKSLQHDVLGCRWFTLPLLKECQRDMFYAAMQKRIFGPSAPTVAFDPASRDVLNQRLGEEDPGQWNMILPGTIRRDDLCALYICPSTVSFMEPSGVAHFLPMVIWTIPDKFFERRPWTDEKFQLLHHLLMFTPYGLVLDVPAEIYPSLSSFDIPRERIQDCIHHAIMEENVWILSELLAWDERAYNCAINGVDMPEYEIRGEHFITAVKRSEGPGLLQVLLRGGAESIPHDDPEITEWALRQKNGEFGEFGEWLLSYLVEVPPRRQGLFSLFEGGWALRYRRGRDFPDDPQCYVWWEGFEKYVKDQLPKGRHSRSLLHSFLMTPDWSQLSMIKQKKAEHG
ncbi:hypothetical protein BDBG_06852 [Blastomyces gilchristii SLH14081]|uniref:Uncharacterized protein n=1 Tax=Blastomyces gilchristii (strain SLH14081) TaxID=559298 RepID=A0A179UTI9_BLAGS|nr:uncharacterized protein BDBG_06852 [Blastomyces gilchristii SLH14081]OAT11344.1 hypothetical protein BDBG_06852 [Blastomyces gilchristii SLH14081]